MKQIIVIILLCLSYSGYSQVIFSEIQSSNNSTIADEWGDYDDWIEIYNPNDHTENIEGMVLKNNAHIWGIPMGDPSTLLSPYSYFLIWADHEESEGLFHANFRLSTSESLIICESDSATIIDSISIPSVNTDDSYGICPGGEWRIFSTPSPMEANDCETTSINSIRTNNLKIYPTVTSDKIVVKIPQNIEDKADIKLISIFGNTLLERKFVDEELTIDLEPYCSGLYIVLLSSQHNIWSVKIIKTN